MKKEHFPSFRKPGTILPGDQKDSSEVENIKKPSSSGKTENESRRLYYTGTIDEAKCEKIVTGLLDLEAQDPTKDILFYIDSYGGFVDSFFAMHDAMKMLRCNVATIGIGKTMSCGLLLLISGTPGYRFITPNARVLIHQVSAGTFGNVSEMEDDVKAALEMQKRICKLIVEYTKISKNKLEKIMERQSYFSAKEALEMGIVDEIAESNNQIYRKVKV